MSTSAGRNNTRPMGGRWLSERQPKRKYSAIGSGDDYPLTKERAAQATDRTPCTAPTVATRTQLVVHAACGAYIGPVAAELCTTKRPLEAPLVSVRKNTCPAKLFAAAFVVDGVSRGALREKDLFREIRKAADTDFNLLSVVQAGCRSHDDLCRWRSRCVGARRCRHGHS